MPVHARANPGSDLEVPTSHPQRHTTDGLGGPDPTLGRDPLRLVWAALTPPMGVTHWVCTCVVGDLEASLDDAELHVEVGAEEQHDARAVRLDHCGRGALTAVPAEQ